MDANVRAAGKGLLADIIALIITGRRFSVMSYTPDKEELRKRITTLAVEGERMVLLDNLAGLVGNDVLDAALTSDFWKDRLLGSNTQYNGPLSISWYATGNNVQLAADTSRRVCHIRLESTEERPETRTGVKYPDLKAHVYSDRENLLSAALTILRGWVVAGRPTHNLKAWGSFQSWSDVVREAVVFAGLPDPGETRVKLQTVADRDAANMETIIDGLRLMDAEGSGLTTTEIIKRLKADDSPDTFADMRSAVEEFCSKLDGRLLSYKFRHFKRRNFAGKMLDVASNAQGVNRWVVVSLTTPREPEDANHRNQNLPVNGCDGGDGGHVSARPTSQTKPPTLYDSTSIDPIFR